MKDFKQSKTWAKWSILLSCISLVPILVMAIFRLESGVVSIICSIVPLVGMFMGFRSYQLAEKNGEKKGLAGLGLFLGVLVAVVNCFAAMFIAMAAQQAMIG